MSQLDEQRQGFTNAPAHCQDASRSQQILDSKGEENSTPAPVLAPATIEGKAVSDELIAVRAAGGASRGTVLTCPSHHSWSTPVEQTETPSSSRRALRPSSTSRGVHCRGRFAGTGEQWRQAGRGGRGLTGLHNSQAALERYKAEAEANGGTENPRTAAMTEKLVQVRKARAGDGVRGRGS